MPQNPITISGLSTGGATVWLGGLRRNVQVSLEVTGASSAIAGSVTASYSDTQKGGQILLYYPNPSPGDPPLLMSAPREAFYEYLIFSTDQMSSAYWNGINARVHFDGPQWVSS